MEDALRTADTFFENLDGYNFHPNDHEEGFQHPGK